MISNHNSAATISPALSTVIQSTATAPTGSGSPSIDRDGQRAVSSIPSVVSRGELLSILEAIVEKHTQEAVTRFQNLSASELLKPAAHGGWSIAQCLDHLNGYGDFYLPCIKKGLIVAPVNSRADTFRSSWFGKKFTKMMDPQTGKKKIKAMKKHIPSEHLDAHRVVATFIQQQETLMELLRQAEHADLNKIRIPLSIARFFKLRLGDVFQFMIAHNERHMQQAKRNL